MTRHTVQPGIWLMLVAFFCFAAAPCGSHCQAAEAKAQAHMQITSSAFTEGSAIPAKYSCEGKDASPPLKLSGVPPEAKSLVLIADDPDAPVGTWVHWVLFDVAPGTAEFPEGLPGSQFVLSGAKQGVNDFKRLGYGGPCPPPGKPHRYYFKVYALDTLLELKPGASKKDVEAAMQKHVLAQAQLMGTFKRS